MVFQLSVGCIQEIIDNVYSTDTQQYISIDNIEKTFNTHITTDKNHSDGGYMSYPSNVTDTFQNKPCYMIRIDRRC